MRQTLVVAAPQGSKTTQGVRGTADSASMADSARAAARVPWMGRPPPAAGPVRARVPAVDPELAAGVEAPAATVALRDAPSRLRRRPAVDSSGPGVCPLAA